MAMNEGKNDFIMWLFMRAVLPHDSNYYLKIIFVVQMLKIEKKSQNHLLAKAKIIFSRNQHRDN